MARKSKNTVDSVEGSVSAVEGSESAEVTMQATQQEQPAQVTEQLPVSSETVEQAEAKKRGKKPGDIALSQVRLLMAAGFTFESLCQAQDSGETVQVKRFDRETGEVLVESVPMLTYWVNELKASQEGKTSTIDLPKNVVKVLAALGHSLEGLAKMHGKRRNSLIETARAVCAAAE